MILKILNYLHRKQFWKLLNFSSQIMYFIKGFGFVPTHYHPHFRAFEYKVKGKTFLSMGPGWAYNFEYLLNALQHTYNHYYLPVPGDCVIDIGAGLGEETVIYAQLVGEKGKVLALEANPVTHAGLQYMVETNRFHWVMPLHLAIFNKNSEVTIEDDNENYLTNTINTSSATANSFIVKSRTLDSLVQEYKLDRIDFLKSNIEGAEQFLIEGMKDSLRLIRYVCISCHDFRHVHHAHGEFYMTKEKIKSFLEENGFIIKTRNTGNRVIDDYIYGVRSDLT